jgi:23S rRNA G2445 N2-methylase RlmL
MSANNESQSSNAAADEVRKAFAALPWDQKVCTMLRIELDMVGDVVETVVNAASRAADEIADAFSNRGSAEPSATTDPSATVI